MIKVETEPSGEHWDAWKTAAQAETEAAIIEFRRTGRYDVKQRLYKAGAPSLVQHFKRKCGYCESVVVDATVRNPDVEHYRPKGRLREYPGKGVVTDDGGRAHPGYFWLAYTWSNLLPSCPACNRPGTQTTSRKTVGKWDFFPIMGRRVFDPTSDDIDEIEQPQLLNPWRDDPAEHLTFDDRTGIIGSRTVRGKVTIDLLDLNRDGLLTQRNEAVQAARVAVANYALAYFQRLPNADELLRIADAQRSSALSHSAFRRKFVEPALYALAQHQG